MKYCSRCESDKNELDFNKGQVWCKICQSSYKKQYDIENREKNKQYKIQYDSGHVDIQREYVRSYRENNKESVAQNRRQYVNTKRVNDPVFRLNGIISSSINKSLKRSRSSKRGSSKSKYLPYTIQELKEHIEKQFESWMTWDNQGVYNHKTWNDNDKSTWTWNIDHIIPRADLPYSSMQDDNFRKCWSLDNLRPLSAKQNIIEGANLIRHRRK